MILEIEVGLIAVAAVVLVGFLVPLLIQLRKMVEESQRLIQRLNYDLPLLITEATGAAQVVNRAASAVREGTERAKVLGQAMGAIGDTVNHLHGIVRSGTASAWSTANGLVAGIRAGVQVLSKGRRREEPLE
jgi:uncharacterized protein YoxC